MARRFVVFIVLLSLFIVPVFADNTVGEIQQDLEFVGFNIGDATNAPAYLASDGQIQKYFGSGTVQLRDTPYVNLYFRLPPDVTIISIAGSFGLAISDCAISLAEWYIYTRVNDATGTIERLGSVGVSAETARLDDNFRSYTFRDRSYSFTGGDYLVLRLSLVADRDPILHPRIQFSDYASTVKLQLNPYKTLAPIDLDITGGTLSSTGRVGFRSISSSYAGSSTSDTIYSVSNCILNLVPLSSGDHYGARFSTTSVLSQIFGGVSLGNGTVDSDAVIRTNDSGTFSATSGSGTVTLPSYSGSFRSGNGINASEKTTLMAYGFMSAWYGDDDGLVDTVKHMDKTLDGVADNMQTIIDDMQTHTDTANDIGGTVSDGTISNTDATLSTGVGSLDTVSTEGVTGFSALDQYGSGLVSLMAIAMPELIFFGDGNPIYFAILVFLGLTLLIFILRRIV